jgi:hypothetical protein
VSLWKRFLTFESVRPGILCAISVHLFPISRCSRCKTRKRGLSFLSICCVCPEPVLANVRFFQYKMAQKRRFSYQQLGLFCRAPRRLRDGRVEVLLSENASLVEFSLCLSRACLGKMSIFSIQSGRKVPCSHLPTLTALFGDAPVDRICDQRPVDFRG